MALGRRISGVVHGLGLGGALYGGLAVTAAAAWPLRGDRRRVARVVRAVSNVAVPLALRLGGIRVVTRGQDRIRALAERGGYILVANHASNLDPLALIQVVGRVDLAFVAKAETLRRPVLGALLDAIGWFAVERDSLAALKKLGEEVEARRQTGWVPDLVVFPEGTRSPDGRLQKFRIGPFMLAARLGLPIVPVVIRGTAPLHGKDAFMVQPGTVTVEVCEPIEPPAKRPKALELVDVAERMMRRAEAVFRAVPDLNLVELAPAAPAPARAQGAA